ncbi:MAG: hypothetical protein GWP08_04885 [Nitrospiraceae bacterium]|nr:hypothetical protein [Nitrospiraceae bacterium]
MAKKAAALDIKNVDPHEIASALAKAMCEGDIVNFRLIFMPFSPARKTSTESFDMPKYAYLQPGDTQQRDPRFQQCLAMVERAEMMNFIQSELDANRPAQLPSELLLALADHAVREGKFTNAAQACELLRIRPRMQQIFYEQADAALDAGDVAKGVRGYRIATGLAYDYAAFPEPLPATPDYQTRALVMHADYPQDIMDCVGMQDTEPMIETALNYLLLEPEAVARLEKRPVEIRLAFLTEWVRRQDPRWDTFKQQYKEACALATAFGKRLEGQQEDAKDLAGAIEEQQQSDDPRSIAAALLGRTIGGGEWWQYLKELACEHPASALFVARQAVGDIEILLPRRRSDSAVARALGLCAGAASDAPSS